MTPSRLLPALLLLCATQASALDIAPGTTSPSLQAEGCITDEGDTFGGQCPTGCSASCDLGANTAEAFLLVDNATFGRRFAEATAHTDFTVTASENGAATALGTTITYDIEWNSLWSLVGLATGFNDARSEITLTLTDRTAGTVVTSTSIHAMDVDGFGIDIIDAGTGTDKGSTVNSVTTRVLRGHEYRLGLKVRCEAKGVTNAFISLDYQTAAFGAWWNDLQVSIAPDLAEEIEKLKKRVEALEHHTHTYLTGRGEGHNNTEAETSKPILVVEEPSDEERRHLPTEDPDAVPLPVRTVFLGNAPNPFNPTTTITYTLPEPLHVKVWLFTAEGQIARTLVDADRPSGPHAMAVELEGLPSGVYYYRLTAGRFTETRKLTLLK